MLDIPIPERKRAIIVSLEPDTDEMVELSRSMNYEIVRVFVQRRRAPNPKFFIGKGKVEEVTGFLSSVEGEGVDVAVVNSPLKPTQIFHLQNAWDITVFDRTRLILEIFMNRARSQEARLQVELARLEYEVPLVKELIHRSKMGEHPGYMAGGEYRVDQYYEMIRKRIKRIRERLGTVKKDGSERRRHRREQGFILVSMAGYTNAGKSMLLKALTKEDTFVEDRFFTTLFTLTRKGEGRKGGAFLFSDTVGFIKDLPPWLVDAFHSTLEEIFLSDMVLLVIDISEPEEVVLEKALTSFRFLQKDGAVPTVLLVFNKSDLVDDMDRCVGIMDRTKERLIENHVSFVDAVTVSARTGQGIDGVMDMILRALEGLDYVRKLTVDIPRTVDVTEDGVVGTERIVNWLFSNYIVLEQEDKGEGISLVILSKKHDIEKARNFLARSGIVPRN